MLLAAPGVQVHLSLHNTGQVSVYNLTLEPAFLAQVLICDAYNTNETFLAGLWGNVSLESYQSISCRGTYQYTDEQLDAGQAQYNVTVSGVTAQGTAYTSLPRNLSMTYSSGQYRPSLNVWCHASYNGV